jgi:hypothetical protein
VTSLTPFALFSYEEFQSWFVRDYDRREELYELMGGDPGIGLESLDDLEQFLLGRFDSVEEALELDGRGVTDAAGRHVGLVVMLATEGVQWGVELDERDSVYFRLPVLKFPDGYEECPITMVTAALDRRSGSYLRPLAEGYAADYGG